ncbi:MAG: hypothetical protein M3303_11650 [Gemmatimonadota bacterium]|nr:hypothetical protein [Gemmatimonadota bacterium]
MSSSERSRWVALIGSLTHERRVAHTDGFPLDAAEMLPLADVVLVVPDDGGGAMLFRYTACGNLGGDTWHATVAEALEQAAYEYGDALIARCRTRSPTAHAFAVRYACERLDKGGDW